MNSSKQEAIIVIHTQAFLQSLAVLARRSVDHAQNSNRGWHSYQDPAIQCSLSIDDDPGGLRPVNSTLKNAYAARAFKEVAASSAELVSPIVNSESMMCSKPKTYLTT